MKFSMKFPSTTEKCIYAAGGPLTNIIIFNDSNLNEISRRILFIPTTSRSRFNHYLNSFLLLAYLCLSTTNLFLFKIHHF